MKQNAAQPYLRSFNGVKALDSWEVTFRPKEKAWEVAAPVHTVVRFDNPSDSRAAAVIAKLYASSHSQLSTLSHA